MILVSLACDPPLQTLTSESLALEAQFPLEIIGLYTTWHEVARLSVTGQGNDVGGATDCDRLC